MTNNLTVVRKHPEGLHIDILLFKNLGNNTHWNKLIKLDTKQMN